VTGEGTEGPTLGPTTPPNAAAIEAAGAYLEESGIDGNKGELTDPVNCSEITDDTEGEFCVHDTASVFAPGLTILVVGDTQEPNETAWDMRLVPVGSGWEVSSVSPHRATE
jgi:hypothetical protein